MLVGFYLQINLNDCQYMFFGGVWFWLNSFFLNIAYNCWFQYDTLHGRWLFRLDWFPMLAVVIFVIFVVVVVYKLQEYMFNPTEIRNVENKIG